jgi:hypothetical protein
MPENKEPNGVYRIAQYIFFKRVILRRFQMLILCGVHDRRINQDGALVELYSQGENRSTQGERKTCPSATLSATIPYGLDLD